MKNKNILYLALATAALLSIPLLATLFGGEVHWSIYDFVFAGVLIFGTGLIYELISRGVKNNDYRIGLVISLGAGFLLIWSNLAVGIIGSEDNPFNTMYFGVILIGIIGALLSRFKPNGMAWTLFTMAIAQGLVPLIALSIGRPDVGTAEQLMGVIQVLGINAFFILLFITAGIFFRKANIEMLAKD